MLHKDLQVARTIGELAGLSPGTRIATNHNKLLILDEFAAGHAWFEQGELTPYQPLVHWLPAFILPPRVYTLAAEEAAYGTVCELRVEEDEV
jgi:hypothetical protein